MAKLQVRTSIYVTDEDKAVLRRLEQYGIKTSTAYRVGIRLLAEALDGNRTTSLLDAVTKESIVPESDWLEIAKFARGYINQTNPGGTAALEMLNAAIEKTERRE
jgi:hypothetical protein